MLCSFSSSSITKWFRVAGDNMVVQNALMEAQPLNIRIATSSGFHYSPLRPTTNNPWLLALMTFNPPPLLDLSFKINLNMEQASYNAIILITISCFIFQC